MSTQTKWEILFLAMHLSLCVAFIVVGWTIPAVIAGATVGLQYRETLDSYRADRS